MFPITIGILLMVVLFYVRKKWILEKEVQRLSKDLLWDNQEIENIGRTFLANKSFTRGRVGKRIVWYRIEAEKLQIVKVKKRKLRIGYGVDWQSKKRYDESLIDLGAFEGKNEEEIIGAEKLFLFREYSAWTVEKADSILEDSFKILSYFFKEEKEEKMNALKDFSQYKIGVENLKNEELM